MTVNPIRFDGDRRGSSREVVGDGWVRAFFPVGDVLQQSFCLGLKAFRTLSQGMILEIPRGNISD